LMLAAGNGYKDIVQLLLAAGADIRIKDGRGSTALMWARENGHKEFEGLLF